MSTIINHRRPVITIQRSHGWETRQTIALFWNGARAANGDGIHTGTEEEAGAVDYANPLLAPVRLWPVGKLSMFGGRFMRGAFARLHSFRGRGLFTGRFMRGPFGGSDPYLWTWTFPFDLRNGTYLIGYRTFDAVGNLKTSDYPIEIIVQAAPRPARMAEVTAWDVGAGELGVAWQASPDFLAN